MGNIVNKRTNNVNQIDENKFKKTLEEQDFNMDENKKKELYNKIVNSCSINDNEKDKDSITLSYILNLIDGVLEQSGRILIITTNFPKKLDKALIRPGRIDLKIKFKKCNKKVCKDIISFYFDNNKIPNFKFNEYKYTPAEILKNALILMI